MWEEFFLKDWNLNILKDLFYVMDGTNTTQIMFGAAGLRWAGGLAGAWEGGVGLGGFGGCWIKDSFRSSELDATYSLSAFAGEGVGADFY